MVRRGEPAIVQTELKQVPPKEGDEGIWDASPVIVGWVHEHFLSRSRANANPELCPAITIVSGLLRPQTDHFAGILRWDGKDLLPRLGPEGE